MKKLIVLILIIFVFALSGCGMSESASEAKLYGNNFILSLIDGGENTISFLHTNHWPGQERVDDFISQLERANEIDFSDGVEIVDCEWNMSALHSSSFNGRANQYTYELLVSGKTVYMFVVVVDNDVDYGVMYFGIYDPNLE